MEKFSFNKMMDVGNEENKVIELGLLMELNSEEQYNDLKIKITDLIVKMFDEKIEIPDLFDFLLLEAPFDTEEGLCGSINIDIYANEAIFRNTQVDLFKYVQETNFRVISELEGSTEDFYFPMNLNGFMNALKKYNQLLLKKQVA